MRPPLLAVMLLLLCISAINSLAQVNIFRPEIIGQTPSPLTTTVNQPITIQLTNLIVVDADPLPVYPNGFTLDVGSGDDYDVDDDTVIPDQNFTGMLTVPVRVSDGNQKSRNFNLKIQVTGSNNVAPEITGQVEISIQRAQGIKIELAHLIVTDPDNNYPGDFSLRVFNGNNYNRNGNTITPSPNFTGTLTVPVSVNDGENDSERFDLKIVVKDPQNVVPIITGQSALAADEEKPLTLKLSDLQVTDPDDSYPNGFSLLINQGANYSVSGATITPAINFYGPLTVQVVVNDGTANSAAFPLQITVNPINDSPIITGQVSITTTKNTSVSIGFNHLQVSDPDSNYPSGFSLKLSPGADYTIAGTTVNPRVDFTGQLTVNVSVNDGRAESNKYPLKIKVEAPKNIAPVITGQRDNLSLVQNTSLKISTSHFLVTDPDNVDYPKGFTVKVLPGDNYAVEGTTIRPLPNFVGDLSVNVTVNDGVNDSAPYGLKIKVIPPSTKPIINGQGDVVMEEDTYLDIELSMLSVTDADNPNAPKGYSLRVQSDPQGTYTVAGNRVTPALNLNGFIEVGVTVSDGVNTSDLFSLSILVEPVNDAPEIANFDTTAMAYEPGEPALNIFESLELIDVDNDHLTMVEIGFDSANYSSANDLLTLNDSTNINVIYDPSGILFLVGYGTLEEYQAAIRSIQYNYYLTQDQNGNPTEILSGPRSIYILLHDGQLPSGTHRRIITMETNIALDIPNTFTPNGDNSNDTWKIRSANKSQLGEAVIRVYNKRGLLLYETTGFEKEWDGIAHGQILPVDTYYYIIDLHLTYMKQTYKGVVTILH